MRTAMLVMVWAAAVGAATPRLVGEVPVTAGAEPVIMVVPIDFDQAANCFDPRPVPDPRAVVAAVARGDGFRALPSQWDPDPDAPFGRTTGELTIALSDVTAGQPLTIFFTPGSDLTPPAATEPVLTVARANGAITVSSPDYALTHDPRKLAGLPSRIEFKPSGKVFEEFRLNDRVYDKTIGGFNLRSDPNSKVRLVAAGPLRVAVEVAADYVNDAGAQPPSKPSAVYRFDYFTGSPRIEVNAEITQDDAYDWRELHFLELHFGDESFPGWVGGEPFEDQTLSGGKKSWQKAWGGFRDGDSVLALLGVGNARFYDGRGEYGTYVHGPWQAWGSREQRFRKTLYVSGRPNPIEAVREAASRQAPEPVRLAPSATVELLTSLRQRAALLSVEQRTRVQWWLAIASARLWRADWTEAQSLATEVQSALAGLPTEARALDAWLEQRTGWTVISSPRLGVALDGPNLVSLYDATARRELISVPSPLWQLQLRDEDKVQFDYGPEVWPAVASPEKGQRLGQPTFTVRRTDQPGLELRFGKFPAERPAGAFPAPEVALDLRIDGPRLAIALRLDNQTPFSVEQIECPVIRLGRLGDSGADDVFFFPRGAGEVQADPISTGAGWNGLYPGGWSTMQYEAVYDGDGGVYLAAEDPLASTKETFAQGPDGTGTIKYGVRWPAPDMSVPGNDWEMSGESAVEVFAGDWYDAAQIYRTWAAEKAEWWPARKRTHAVPAAIAEVAVWALASGTPQEPNNVVPKVTAFANYLGVPAALHWYNWHQIPFDNDYPHYDPPKEGVKEGVAELQAAGVKVMPYINGRLWDSELEDFAEARPYATSMEDGEPYIETYGSKVPLAAMCPTTEFWQDKQNEIVTWLCGDIGMDGVYMDQVAAAKPRLCYNPDHGHPLGGGHWWTTDGYWPMLAKIRASIGTDKFLTTECNAEPYMQYFDGYLTWHWQYQNQVPAFSAVYADQVVLFSRAYRGGDSRELANRMKAAQSLVFGEQIGWISPDVINQPSASFIRRCAQVRRQLVGFLGDGRMLRVPALAGEVPELTADWQWSGVWPVTLPAVQTGAWQARDGRVALIFANFSPDSVPIDCPLRAADYGFGNVTELVLTPLTAVGEQAEQVLGGAQTSLRFELPPEKVAVFLVRPAE